MKKIRLLTLLPITLLVSACASMGFFDSTDSYGWNDYGYHNHVVGSIVGPCGPVYGHEYQNYQQPRRYYVTADEQRKYEAVNMRVQKRMHDIHNKGVNTTTPSASSYASPTHYEPPTNHTVEPQIKTSPSDHITPPITPPVAPPTPTNGVVPPITNPVAPTSSY